jgi:hypothetical protein
MSTMSAALGVFLTNVATTYAKAVDRKLSTVSLAAADDPNILPRIAAGGGKANFTIERFDRIVGWFAEHWPPDTAWPAPPPWPFPHFMIPTPVPTGENNGKDEGKASTATSGRKRRSNGKAKTKGRKAAKGCRKETQHRSGERSAD